MSDSFRPIRARIDLSALQNNLQQVSKLAPNSKILAVIKANGYGHGLLTVAKALSQADGFAVASLDEAIKLRQAGFLHPILLLEGVFSEAEWRFVLHYRLDTVIHHFQQLEWFIKIRQTNAIHAPTVKIPSPALTKSRLPSIWLKCDTGMHRLGFLAQEMFALKQQLMQLEKVHTVWMSHFATADEDLSFAQAQLQQFLQQVPAEGLKSFANSAAIQHLPASQLDWVRPGIMLYGVADENPACDTKVQLKPAMIFEAQVIALKKLQPGDCVGYGCDFIAQKPMQLAILAVGYGDGYLRQIANHPKASVFYQGQCLPIVGRVSMDMLTIDVSSVAKQIRLGHWVELWGRNLPVQEVASWANTISYELLCGVAQRVPRMAIESDQSNTTSESFHEKTD